MPISLKRPQQLADIDRAQFEGARDAQQIIPILFDQVPIDRLTRQTIQHAVVSRGIHAPEARLAHIGQPWTELSSPPRTTSESRSVPVTTIFLNPLN